MSIFDRLKKLLSAAAPPADESTSEYRRIVAALPGMGHYEWAHALKEARGTRPGLPDSLRAMASELNREEMGLSGGVIDELLSKDPIMVPSEFWGGQNGWRSIKRRKVWESVLKSQGVRAIEPGRGVLVRFRFDPTAWVPHPYMPDAWLLKDFATFSTHLWPDRRAFKLCEIWERDNSAQLTSLLRTRLSSRRVKLGARFVRGGGSDYADVAFLLPKSRADLEVITKVVWKGEYALFEFLESAFPDACREYAAPWLGQLRLDVFVPSLKLAFEYQGEQHFKPVKVFGGQDALAKTQDRDRRKALACKAAGVTLIEWLPSEAISLDVLRRKLATAGVPFAERQS